MPSPDYAGECLVLPWEPLSSRVLLDVPPWLRVLEDSVRLPGGRVIHDYYRVEMPDYVLVAVRDQEGRFLLERQYKHGSGSILLTSPSGGVEPDETPLAAAQRELLEETGFRAEGWTSIGSFLVDGTRGLATAHFFVATGLRQVVAARHSDIETCEVVFLTPDEVRTAILDGTLCLLPDVALYSLLLGPVLLAPQGVTP